MSGRLILIPTPLDEALPLEPVALELLKKEALMEDSILLVEEHKVARQRWLRWGLPREAIDRFVLFNEHTQEQERNKIISELIAGKVAYLMSDGGLPAFCDPGQKLVRDCHEKGIQVGNTPFPNSIAMAVALSGFDHSHFGFAGFLSTEPNVRKKQLEEIAARNETTVIMDTPYRLKALVADIAGSRLKGRKFFLATNLDSGNQKCYFGNYTELQKAAESLQKPEFVLLVSGS